MRQKKVCLFLEEEIVPIRLSGKSHLSAAEKAERTRRTNVLRKQKERRIAAVKRTAEEAGLDREEAMTAVEAEFRVSAPERVQKVNLFSNPLFTDYDVY